MATTVATAVSTVKERLLVDNASQTAPPSDSMIEGYIRDAFRYMFGTLHPVFREQVTLDSSLSAALTTPGQIMYVSVNRTLLFPNEWTMGDDELLVEGHNIANNGDEAEVWMTRLPSLSGSTIESSCIFGTDWLEPPALIWAEMLVFQRLSNTSNSATGQYSLTQYRVREETLDKMINQYRATRAEFIATMDNRLNVRAMMGRPAMRDNSLHNGWGRSGTRARAPMTGRS